MNFALTRPFETITQLDFKLRKRIDASDLRNKDNLMDLNTKIMSQFQDNLNTGIMQVKEEIDVKFEESD
jgi:hypothetical protein